MARRKSPNLTDAELRLMDVLWSKGASSVADVVDALPRNPAPAYSTVLTMLRILEKKGYVKHAKQGRAFIYEPVVDRSQARSNVVRYLLDRFFGNSPEALVLNLVEDHDISVAELRRIKELLENTR